MMGPEHVYHNPDVREIAPRSNEAMPAQRLLKMMQILDILASDLEYEAQKSTTSTVTGRITSLGDMLQYLLDHIEL